jgi:hypothetical protein
MIKTGAALSLWMALTTLPAIAEMELSIYAGVQNAPHSRTPHTAE